MLLRSRLDRDGHRRAGRGRLRARPYRLDDMPGEFPPELRPLVHDGIVRGHAALQIYRSSGWLDVDATFDRPLKELGFVVTEGWDGRTSMPLVVVPLSRVETDELPARKEAVLGIQHRTALPRDLLARVNAWLDDVRHPKEGQMAEQNIKDVVKDKYAKAALRVTSGSDASCCGTASSRGSCDPVTSKLYEQGETAGLPQEAVAASLGCGNPTALAELAPGRGRARPRLGRGHRRAPVRASRRAHRQGVRARHDRRDARARAGEPAQGRRRERRVPQGRDRADPAARQQRGRHHLELRDQPVRRQGPRVRGGVPRAEARRPARGVRRGRAG